MFFGVCVAGGRVGEERRGGGDYLPGGSGEYWSVEEFGAGGGEVVGEEEIGGGEEEECDGDAEVCGVESVEDKEEVKT